MAGTTSFKRASWVHVSIATLLGAVLAGAAAADTSSSPPGSPGGSLAAPLESSLAEAAAVGGTVTIIESQSTNSGHDMDSRWQQVASGMGYSAGVAPQSTLDDISSLAGTDILVISSGVIDLPAGRRATIQQFVDQGGPV